MKNIKTAILKEAKLVDREEQIRADLEKMRAARSNGKRGWHCMTTHSTGITLQVDLASYLSVAPDAKPTLHEFDHDGRHLRYMSYPPHYVGDIRAGYHLWIQAQTAREDSGPATVKPDPEVAKAEQEALDAVSRLDAANARVEVARANGCL